MTTGVLVWLIVFGIAALMFFVIALVVGVKGVGDLRDLLRGAGKGKDTSV